jgi:ADP-ribosyl-[dinitrogen reductase] hydrolase
MKTLTDKIKASFIGFATGDALGVPVEFESRGWLQDNPVTDMIGYMRYNQPSGTWSDDSSLVFCTADSLCNGYHLEDIGLSFSRWRNDRLWTPHGRVFDIGIQTQKAIDRIDRLIETGLRIKPFSDIGVNEKENGNGSLMRILPLAFYLLDKPAEEQFRIIREVSSLTHPHIRAVIGCFIYVRFLMGLIHHGDKIRSYAEVQEFIPDFLAGKVNPAELEKYSRILKHPIAGCAESTIESSPYVLHTLEASLWCVMKEDTYRDTVTHAVNLGYDTDTIAAIAGGAAGLIYGMENIPDEWVECLARKNDILELAERFGNSLV